MEKYKKFIKEQSKWWTVLENAGGLPVLSWVKKHDDGMLGVFVMVSDGGLIARYTMNMQTIYRKPYKSISACMNDLNIPKDTVVKFVDELRKHIPKKDKMNESLVIQSSLDTSVRDMMFDLFSRIVCAQNYAHVLHLNADSGGQHLMLEKIYNLLDDMIDELGEIYFMARNIKIPNPLLKANEYATGDLGDLLTQMSGLVDVICNDENVDESLRSMVSGFGESIQRCMGFWRQAEADSVI